MTEKTHVSAVFCGVDKAFILTVPPHGIRKGWKLFMSENLDNRDGRSERDDSDKRERGMGVEERMDDLQADRKQQTPVRQASQDRRGNVYRDIAERTGGDVYIGVVGPVRTGKSTFIKKFMEELVLPNISGGYSRDRARDELPQSAAGKTVMTTEPKFIPNEAVPINVGGGGELRVRMIDCVGYIVPGALGAIENEKPRMVHTPWSDRPLPFIEAAEEGTHRVICEHSTIGMVVTTDGTIGDIPRAAYEEAEARVIRELTEIGKPFAIVLNSAHPESEAAIALGHSLEESWGVPVALVNCTELDGEDIREILAMILDEFPVSEVSIKLPDWIATLDPASPIRRSIDESVRSSAAAVGKAGEIAAAFSRLAENEYIGEVHIDRVDLGSGRAAVSICAVPGLLYRVLGDTYGIEIGGEADLLAKLSELTEIKKKYDRIASALADVESKGYGIVMPGIDELKLEEPQSVRQAGGFGVRVRATAESIHMIRAGIEAEINPIVGSEEQARELIGYLLREGEKDVGAVWRSNMFGRSLYELVSDGLRSKLENIPDDARQKLSETLERIVNEGSGGLICILL